MVWEEWTPSGRPQGRLGRTGLRLTRAVGGSAVPGREGPGPLAVDVTSRVDLLSADVRRLRPPAVPLLGQGNVGRKDVTNETDILHTVPDGLAPALPLPLREQRQKTVVRTSYTTGRRNRQIRLSL